jgi:hypothetical protein
MFRDTKAFSSFSTDGLEQAKQFYGKTLGLEIVEIPEGLELHIAGSTPIFIYPSDTYTPPKHTVLNFLSRTSRQSWTSSPAEASRWSSTTYPT